MTSNFKIFKGDFCIPEAQYTAREDSASVAVVVLKTAIKDAPNKEGAKMLTCNKILSKGKISAFGVINFSTSQPYYAHIVLDRGVQKTSGRNV